MIADSSTDATPATSFSLCSGFAQRVGLRLAPSFRHGLREVRKDYGEPQPHGDLESPAEAAYVVQMVAHQLNSGQQGAHFHDEHHRVLDHRSRIQFAE